MRTFGRRPQTRDQAFDLRREPDWKQADPRWIRSALKQALKKPSGGWFVIDASRNLGDRPKGYRIAGRSLVVWRAEGNLRVAPEACPHMGASLVDAHVEGCNLVCPWHGLELGDEGHAGWKPFHCLDDGVLLWVRLPEEGQESSAAPFRAPRPKTYVDAVVRMEATCEPQDVIANRLDPWHGTHYHPHSFARLHVIERDEESITCRVVYRLMNKIGVEVDAKFSCPDPRTIVMTIVDGEGEGSVVETHATPVSAGTTAVIEATLATSDRMPFKAVRAASPVVRPLMHWAAKRLWVEDAAYAERRYRLRRPKD